MLSRVANSIHWMGRYVERAENVARFIDVNMNLMLDFPIPTATQWSALVNTTGDHKAFAQRYHEATRANVIEFLTFDKKNPNSIFSCMKSARERARTIREVVFSEMWEQINRSYLMLRDAQASGRVSYDPAGFFSHFKKACHLFFGTTDATMSHGEAWHFLRIGRLIERADKTSRILDVKYFILLPEVEYVGSPYDTLQWGALLKSASALEMYRKRFHRIVPRDVAQFLILDREFPRAMRYCLIKAEESLHAVTGTEPGSFRNHAEQSLGRLRAELDYSDVDEIISRGLHEYLDAFQQKLSDLGRAVHETFFATPAVDYASTSRRPAE